MLKVPVAVFLRPLEILKTTKLGPPAGRIVFLNFFIGWFGKPHRCFSSNCVFAICLPCSLFFYNLHVLRGMAVFLVPSGTRFENNMQRNAGIWNFRGFAMCAMHLCCESVTNSCRGNIFHGSTNFCKRYQIALCFKLGWIKNMQLKNQHVWEIGIGCCRNTSFHLVVWPRNQVVVVLKPYVCELHGADNHWFWEIISVIAGVSLLLTDPKKSTLRVFWFKICNDLTCARKIGRIN